MIFYVYEHWRLDRDECFYVGKGSGRRAYSKVSRNRHWRSIVMKLEADGFAYEVRFVATGLSQAVAYNLEKDRIKFWISEDIKLANASTGGDGPTGYTHTEEAKSKIRASKIGSTVSLEIREKISLSKTGKPGPRKGAVTPESTRKKQSEALTAYWAKKKAIEACL